MESLCSAPKLEPISLEELIELGTHLDKNKAKPEAALKLLKVLDKKLITAQILKDSSIGKRLTAVSDNPELTNEPDVIKEIKHMKDSLKKRWTEVYIQFKKAQKERDATKESTATCSIDMRQNLLPRDFKLPYLGEKGRQVDIRTGEKLRDHRIELFIKKLQTPIEASVKGANWVHYPKPFLLHAIKMGQELEQAVENLSQTDEKLKQDKFRQLISVLNEKPEFKNMLLNGDISCEEVVSMKKEGFMSTAQRLEAEKALEAKMAAQRTDWNRELDKKSAATKDGFFTCSKCKSKKTTFFQLQTRGADEPMTNFITCLDCNHQMKK